MKYKGKKLDTRTTQVVRTITLTALNTRSKTGFRRSGKYALGKLTGHQLAVFEAIKKKVISVKLLHESSK